MKRQKKVTKNQIGEVNVIKQWGLLGLRAVCLFFHSEIDAPTSHLTDIRERSIIVILFAIQISFRLDFFVLFL